MSDLSDDAEVDASEIQLDHCIDKALSILNESPAPIDSDSAAYIASVYIALGDLIVSRQRNELTLIGLFEDNTTR